LAGTVVLVLLDRVPDVTTAQRWILAWGPAAPLVYLLGYVVGVLLLVPRPLLSLAGGALFGALWGTALALVGATAGALVCFVLARHLLGDTVARWFGTRLHTLDAWLERHGWLAVLYLRLLPVLPFVLVNYGCGLTSLRMGHFAVGTAVGSLPGTVLLVVAGGSLTDPASPAFVISLALALGIAVVGHLAVRRRRDDREQSPSTSSPAS